MPKTNLVKKPWYVTKTNKLLKDIRRIPQPQIGKLIGACQQTVSYRIREVYPKTLQDLVLILDAAGYEIVEKEEE